MKKFRNFIRDEKGSALVVEATFIYPLLFLVMAFLLYMGLYILHGVLVSTYAQKIAVIAAREVAYPGYMELVNGESVDYSDVFGTVDTDWAKDYSYSVSLDSDDVVIRPYRYWSSGNLLDGKEESLETVLQGMVSNLGMLEGENLDISVEPANHIISQNVTVTINENLSTFGLFDSLGFKTAEISVTAVATVNDPDEFIRNVDMVFDLGEYLAEKLGISGSISKMKEKLNDVASAIGFELS